MNANYVAVGEAPDRIREQSARPTRNSFEASFLDACAKGALVAAPDAAVAA